MPPHLHMAMPPPEPEVLQQTGVAAQLQRVLHQIRQKAAFCMQSESMRDCLLNAYMVFLVRALLGPAPSRL